MIDILEKKKRDKVEMEAAKVQRKAERDAKDCNMNVRRREGF